MNKEPIAFKLVIGEESPEAVKKWRGIFSDVPSVEILEIDPLAFHRTPGLDAEVFSLMLVGERYNVHFEMGRSGVIDTRGETDTPPWIVYLPAFKVDVRWELNAQGEMEPITVYPMGLAEMTFHQFREVFAAVDRFNAESEEKIGTMGLSTYFLTGDLTERMPAIKRAYVEWLAGPQSE